MWHIRHDDAKCMEKSRPKPHFQLLVCSTEENFPKKEKLIWSQTDKNREISDQGYRSIITAEAQCNFYDHEMETIPQMKYERLPELLITQIAQPGDVW